MDFTFDAPETDLVDTYKVSLTVPEIPRQHSAAEVTSVRVSLTVVTETVLAEGLVEGDILASVTLYGYQLAKTGKRRANGTSGVVFGYHEEETRWEIARQALLASCARHGLDAAQVVDHSTLSWAEHQARAQALVLEQFGIRPESREA
jgi:hypothetical protein